MPLLDHFHPPVSDRRSWESFHAIWIAAIGERLNVEVLGPRCFAEVQVRMGRTIEVDVATLSETGYEPQTNGTHAPDFPGGGGMAVAAAPVWAPPAAELAAETVFPDSFEVRVYSTSAGRTLVGAIELVSPGNKDRPDARRAFAAKVVSYLHRKVGVVVVDIVTERSANLHDDIAAMLDLGPPVPFDPAPTTYAVAYRPVRRPDGDRIEMWRNPLTVGGPLPVMPLGLRNLGIVPVDLELTYAEACRRSRLPMVGA